MIATEFQVIFELSYPSCLLTCFALPLLSPSLPPFLLLPLSPLYLCSLLPNPALIYFSPSSLFFFSHHPCALTHAQEDNPRLKSCMQLTQRFQEACKDAAGHLLHTLHSSRYSRLCLLDLQSSVSTVRLYKHIDFIALRMFYLPGRGLRQAAQLKLLWFICSPAFESH